LVLPALPHLCQRLKAVEDLDLAEQCMRWCVRACVRAWVVLDAVCEPREPVGLEG
jgi:hypothetical protein